eukprot:5398296-Amphidinium_carterae.1
MHGLVLIAPGPCIPCVWKSVDVVMVQGSVSDAWTSACLRAFSQVPYFATCMKSCRICNGFCTDRGAMRPASHRATTRKSIT